MVTQKLHQHHNAVHHTRRVWWENGWRPRRGVTWCTSALWQRYKKQRCYSCAHSRPTLHQSERLCAHFRSCVPVSQLVKQAEALRVRPRWTWPDFREDFFIYWICWRKLQKTATCHELWVKTSSFKPGEMFPLLPSELGCVLHSRLSVGALRKFWAWALRLRGRGYRARGRGRKRKRTDTDILKGVKIILQSDVEWNKIFEVCCPILSGIVKVPPPDVPTSTLYTNVAWWQPAPAIPFSGCSERKNQHDLACISKSGSPWCLL